MFCLHIKGKRIPLIKIVCLLCYKAFAQYLPVSYRMQPLGHWSRSIRYHLCRYIFESYDGRFNVERKANFGTGFHIRIGRGSSIGMNAHIPNNTLIGENVMMGPNCYILEQNHVYDRVDIPKWKQGMRRTPPYFAEIQDDVWIGQDVLICPSRKIGKGSVVAARSVVTKNVPEYTVVGGNPAHIIRQYDFIKQQWIKPSDGKQQ